MARAGDVPARLLVDEAAGALTGFGADRLGLVTACRRIVQRHRASGALAYLAGSALVAAEPVAAIAAAATAVDDDPTGALVARHLPPDATMLVVGWPDEAPRSLARRGDVGVVTVDVAGEGRALADALQAADVVATAVPPERLGQAIAGLAQLTHGDPVAGTVATGVVVIEALAAGPEQAAAVPGSLAAAATAAALGVPVWLVVPHGRAQSAAMWSCYAAGIEGCDVVPLDLVDQVVRPTGPGAVGDVVPDCPDACELFAAGW